MSDGISIVVANASANRTAIEPALAGLASELVRPHDQLVWVDRTGRGSPSDLIDGFVAAEPDADRGELYAMGLHKAGNRIVAFTDATTALVPGWRDAVTAAFDDGASILGGPVLPGTRSPVDWAGFLFEYAPHAVPPFLSATGDVAGNNVAYDRSILDAVVDGPVWKAIVNERLRNRGHAPVVAPAMRVVVHKRYGWRGLIWDRLGHGRSYALQRSAEWSTPRRLARAASSPALPALFTARLAARIWTDAGLRSRFAANAPLVFAAAMAWSAGEGLGYAFGGDGRRGLM